MEKSSSAAAAAQTNYTRSFRSVTPGAGTSTTSGVTVYETSADMNHNPPPPPSYEQATGTVTTTTTRNVSYNTAQYAPNGPTQYVAYPTPMSSSTTTYSYAPAQPPPMHIHQHQPGMGQSAPVVIIQQPMLPLGPEPVYITCPACHVQKLTRIEFEPSSRTHLMAALLCLFGLWCCVCLPYCAGSCMNTQHYCGNCGKFLGSYGNAL